MELFIDSRTESELPERFTDIIKTVAEQTLILAGVAGNFEVSVSLVDDGEIREINRHFRNIDRETDVLSFPLIDFFGGNREEPPEIGYADEAEAMGDIIISAGRVFLQAEQYGHSPEREIGFLTAHGMLHLLGYDHMTAEDEKKMFALQEKIMHAVGLER